SIEPAAVARSCIAAAAAGGPTAVVLVDPSLVTTHVPPGVPYFVGHTFEAALTRAGQVINTDAVLLLSARAIPSATNAARAAALLRDPSTGWVTANARPFNEDGYAMPARWLLEQRLRCSARAR